MDGEWGSCWADPALAKTPSGAISFFAIIGRISLTYSKEAPA
jgi:hypothetical protein